MTLTNGAPHIEPKIYSRLGALELCQEVKNNVPQQMFHWGSPRRIWNDGIEQPFRSPTPM